MKIIKSLLVIVAVAAVAGGATYAAYHSEGTVAGATFTATSMGLYIDSNPASDQYNWVQNFTAPSGFPVGSSNVAPGSHGTQIIDILNNRGDVDSKATIKFHVVADTPLYHNMNIAVRFKNSDSGTFAVVTSGPLTDWNNKVFDLGEITGTAITYGTGVGKKASVEINWSVPFEAGNEIMGTNVVVDTTFGLEQVR